MILQNEDATIAFSLFSQFPKLVCFMSTQINGNLNFQNEISEGVVQFLFQRQIKSTQYIAMKQIHDIIIRLVRNKDGGKVISGLDGAITQAQKLFLGINTADCVPLFFYDPLLNIVAVAHAGWKGTRENIAGKTIQLLEDVGSDPNKVLVAIEPHIGGCCYSVENNRAIFFHELFYNSAVVFKLNDEWHIDLGLANKIQLLNTGILNSHIDSPITCTSCQNNLYFSYRNYSQESYGKMLGVIGMRII